MRRRRCSKVSAAHEQAAAATGGSSRARPWSWAGRALGDRNERDPVGADDRRGRARDWGEILMVERARRTRSASAQVVTLAGGAAALLSASCAAIWGFQDASELTDAAPRDAGSLEAGTYDASVMHDAFTGTALESSAPQHDAFHTSRPDAGKVASAECNPACGAGDLCEEAVGGASVCVVESGSCEDGPPAPHPPAASG